MTKGSIATVAVGPAHVENLPVLVQDLAELRKMDAHIEGIIGQDFLSHFNYLLDYAKRSVRIEQDHEIRSDIQGDPVPIDAKEHRMILTVDAQSAGHVNLRLLLDSGANSVVLLPRAYEMLNIAVRENRVESTSSGQVGVRVGQIHSLIVGSKQFHDIAVALAASEPAEQIGDGLLPAALFHAIYVNNREGYVVFNPRDKKN